jgi:ribosomal protein L7/L12
VGQRPGFWGAAAVGAGAFVFADLVGRAVRGTKRSGKAASGAPRSEVTCEVWPEPSPEVLALHEQGLKIQAIKRYRELNPGVGLKDAKAVIDGLDRRVPSEGSTAERRD